MSDNSGKKKEGATKPVEHPKYTEMIKAAIVALKERNGSSLQAIEKYIKCNYKVGDRAHQYIKQALKRGEVSGKFIHTKGVGASGSFKVNKEEEKKAAKKSVPAKKKPAAAKSEKKTKTPAAKISPAKKKPAAKPKPAKKEKKSTTKQRASVPKNSTAKKPSAKKSKENTKAPTRKPAAKKVSKKWTRTTLTKRLL